jgi:hypothetical protein
MMTMTSPRSISTEVKRGAAKVRAGDSTLTDAIVADGFDTVTTQHPCADV